MSLFPYFKEWLNPVAASELFDKLLVELPWQEEWLFFFNRKVKVPRKVLWIADPGLTYTYSRVSHAPHPWTQSLLEIRARLKDQFELNFNGVLCNFYQSGQESVGWHQDREPELDYSAPLISLSLGAERFFSFRHKETRTTEKILLEHGSLLVMTPYVNTHYHHALLKTKKVMSPRLNFTFRVMSL